MVVVGGSAVELACVVGGRVVAGRVVVGLGGEVEIVTPGPAPAVAAAVVGVADAGARGATMTGRSEPALHAAASALIATGTRNHGRTTTRYRRRVPAKGAARTPRSDGLPRWLRRQRRASIGADG